ncbi:MAG TPA: TetR family transcriptional regulator [Acidimicrobiales bacterium]|nr:TetR family transcriptional regulator [Acidimicrobiales bacterium]
MSAPAAIEDLDVQQRARRGRIVAAALDLMLEREHDDIQMRDVTAAAGVALGTVYRYFRSKDHLFAEALLSWSQRFPSAATVSLEGPSVERLKTAYRRAARAFERYPPVYGHFLAIQAATDPAAVEIYERFAISQSDAFRGFLPRVPSPRREQVIDVMSAVLDTNLREWKRGRRSIDEVYEALDVAADLLLA